MRAGRGPVASPLLSNEERCLRDAEVALFAFRAATYRLPDEHEVYQDTDWYSRHITRIMPNDAAAMRLVNRLATQTRVPKTGPLHDKIAKLRNEVRNRRGYSSVDKNWFVDMLEVLLERAYEMKEAEEWTSDLKP